MGEGAPGWAGAEVGNGVWGCGLGPEGPLRGLRGLRGLKGVKAASSLTAVVYRRVAQGTGAPSPSEESFMAV